MKKYEIMYIVRDGLDEETRKAEVAKIHAVLTNNGAEITNVNEWGVRDLAYEIKDQKKGYYVVLKASAPATAINEFDRLGKINATMLRHLIIVDPEK
jgi:small subunit ribosomal protein S6